LSVLDDLPDHVTGIDTLMGGSTEITAGFLVHGERPALIETGPAKVAATVEAGVRAAGLDPGDLGWLIVSHIHLDHAGGLGDLVRAFPNATVVVHPAGAPHLVDPEVLMISSARAYGALLEPVYGPLTPVPANRVHAAEDGEVLDLGGRTLEIVHSPGHARHHLAVFDPDAGTLYAGDAVGVLLPDNPVLRPAMPPPDFDVELAIGSLHKFAERRPDQLVLTHYGPITPPLERLTEAEDKIRRWSEVAEQAAAEHGPDVDHIEAALRARFEAEAGVGPDPAKGEMLNGFRSNATGMARWIINRQRAAAREA
jgi:glyoxylase-like metal-dependent hydrolase (beta-lactamase superfamily II)